MEVFYSMTFLNGNATSPTDIDALKIAGEKAQVKGIINNIREMGEFAFIILRTGTRVIQCVYSPEFSAFELSKLHEGDCVELWGTSVEDNRAQNGFEIRVSAIEVLS